MYKAHMKHEPSCEKISCPYANNHKHDSFCQWVMMFSMNFLDDYRDKIEGGYKENDNPFCCCGDENISHNESIKFKLIM